MKHRAFRRRVLGALALLTALLPALFLLLPALSEEAEPPALSPAAAARRANVPEGNWIWIDLPQKTLTLYQGTEVLKRYPIASGTWETPSPIGVFYITHRFAGELGGFGTRFLGLNVPWGQFGIHGTNRPGSIGSNASHGCIRMFVQDSEELYSHVAAVQRRLISLGYLYGNADGVSGTGTAAAVRRARKVLGLQDGDEVDAAFYRAIGLILFE